MELEVSGIAAVGLIVVASIVACANGNAHVKKGQERAHHLLLLEKAGFCCSHHEHDVDDDNETW
jgi:hypothetical protein